MAGGSLSCARSLGSHHEEDQGYFYAGGVHAGFMRR